MGVAKLSRTIVLSSLALLSSAQDFSVVTGNLSTWNQSDWSLTATSYVPGHYQSRLSLANGYVGASLAAAGPFFEEDTTGLTNGWPLYDTRLSFSTISGFYDVQANGSGTNYPWLNQYGWESFIAGIPHSTAIIFSFGDDYLDATVSNKSISNFASTISFKTGVASWSYTWAPSDDNSFDVFYSAIFSRERPNVVAVKASITSSKNASGTVTDLLDGRSAMRSYSASKGLDDNGTSIYSSVHPDGLSNITAWLVSTADFGNSYTDSSSRTAASGKYVSSNGTTIGQSFNISLSAGETATFYKYIGVASTDKFDDAQATAREASAAAAERGWEGLLDEHVEAWSLIMTENAVDNFTDSDTGKLPDSQDIEILQIASVANTYYLLQSLLPAGSDLNDNSISVGGLVSDSYAGLIFWDADYWMAPGLNLHFPDWSEQISNFRIKQHQQALDNAAFNGYPNGSSLYSWTSGRYGNCTGTGPCVDYEYHLNYDISFNLLQVLNITNNYTWFEDGPLQILESTAMATGELLQYNETTNSYWLHNMTDPDEYANNVDNGVFTISSAASLLKAVNALRLSRGEKVNETWADQAANIEYPRASTDVTLEYQTMNSTVQVKQADVVLLTYPLGYQENYTSSEKLLDLDYYSYRQSPNGPAMTYSVFAVNANGISPSGCAAYTYTLNGFLPYLRGPWYQFSEQANDDFETNGGTNPAFPFLTGHGGANQVVPFGLLGIRTDLDVLYINPSLPPQIPSIKTRTFYYAGAGLQASMNSTHTVLTRFSTNNVTSVSDKYANTSLPFIVGDPSSTSADLQNYSIAVNASVVVPNRLYFQNITYDNNLLQCQTAISPDDYADGQFPIAAIDGAAATSWQPSTNETASLFINLTSVAYQEVTGAYFNWGSRPARNATIFLGNTTLASVDPSRASEDQLTGVETKLTVDDIVISQPFTAASLDAEVAPITGNETILKLGNTAWSGSYVRLEIEGCWEDDGKGATVGEFVLLGAKGV